MSVCRSAKHVYVQFIDDEAQQTLAAVSTLDATFRQENTAHGVAAATALGKMAAERAQAANITCAVFDRGGFRFHGRVKAIADAAREAGLKL